MLTIRQTASGFSLDFAHHSDGELLQLTFGTMLVPLPFSAAADPRAVLTDVACRHPGERIDLIDAGGRLRSYRPAGWTLIDTSVEA